MFLHNRVISLSKSLSIDWVMNQPKVASAYGHGLGRPPPPCLMTGFSKSIRVGGWEKLVVKRRTISIQVKALYKCFPTNINSLSCLRSEHKIHLQEAYQCQGTTYFGWDPLESDNLPWPLIGSPLTWAWPWSTRCQSGGIRSFPHLNRLLWYTPLPSMAATSTRNLILPWLQNLPVIAFPECLIKTIPSLPLTSLFWCQWEGRNGFD